MRELDLKRVFTLFLMLILFIGFCGPVFSESSDKTDIIAELLAGRTTDWQGAASQLSELQLPLALAAVELLKFKAVHSEIPLDTDAAENFAELVRQRIERSLMISFTQTDNCRQPVEAYEVVLAGQKLLVPTHYVADIKLTITACRPDGEAGTVFPEFCIDIFSQSPLAAHSLKIDGKTIPSSKIRLSVISDGYKLTWQPDLNADFMLAIGTHTAEINVTNEAGEQIERHWSFTVGVYDVPTDPLPVDALLLEELTVAANKLVPGADTGLTLTILIYQATDGRRFTEYRIKTASGQIITTRNPAQIARKLKVGRVSDPNITIYPLTSRAFAGNSLTFSYEWLGEGKVISEKWEISSGGHSTGEPTLTMRGDVFARCTLTIEHTGTDAAGNQIVFTTTVTSDKFIQEIAINTSIFPGRDLSLNNTGSATFSIANTVVNNVNFVGMVEGASYEFDNGGSKSILRVDKLSWVVHASDGNAKIADSSATSTYLYCKSPGLTELVVDVKLSWHQAGESYTSNFKPETSGLFAYYQADGRATFDKYPENLVYLTSRMIAIKEFEFTVKQQKRVVTAGNTELAEPVLLGRSSLWPASAPIMITAALPCMVHGRTGKWLSQDGDFRFITPVELDENIDLIPLKLGGRFSTTIYDRDTLFSTQLAPIAIVKPDDGLLELRINPSGPVITYEGATATFTAEVRPTVDFGSGSLSDATDDLDLFDGYRLSKVERIRWFEVLLDASGDWKNNAPAGKGFTHFFTADSGPGSYTMNCAVSLEMKESDTGDTFIVGADNSVPVDVLPGLTIFSPIDELAYPLNATIKVKTSFDADEANWKNIVWRLNGKLFKPDTAGAPFFITANRVGKWSLEAVLTIKDPVTGASTEMRDRITFAVKPCEISLSPGRKVFDMAVQNTQGLDLAVSLDGKTVERPGKAVPWQGNDIIAVVEPVAWSMVATPTACAAIDTDEESFSASLQFSSNGAATVLATVTVRIAGADDYFRRHAKNFEDEFEEPVFTFPAVRADLWAVGISAVSDMNIPENSFPDQAIAGAYRTYELKTFSFALNTGQNKYFYDNQAGWSEPVVLHPALPGTGNIEAKALNFIWEAKSDSGLLQKIQESSTKLVVKPSVPGKYNVVLEILLPFGAGALKVAEKNTVSHAVNLFSLIEVSVAPASFTLPLGDTKTLHYLVKSIENQPALQTGHAHSGSISSGKSGGVLYLLNNSYTLWIDKVQWSDNQSSQLPDPVPAVSAPDKEIIESNAYEFNARVPGQIKGLATGSLNVSELLTNDASPRVANFTKEVAWSAYIQELSIEILINGQPVGELEYYLGQKISLSYRLKHGVRDYLKLDNPVWEISGPKVKAYNPWVIAENPKPCKADILTAKELAAESVALFLYCLDDENYQKTISIRGQISGGHDLAWPCSAVTTIKIQHPRLIEPFPEVPVATLSYYFADNFPYAIYYLGYEKNNYPGPVFDPTVSNQTKINYQVGALQLVMNNHWRKLKEYDNGVPIEKEEVVMTLPLNKKWLDQQFPYMNPQSISAGVTDTISGIYLDSPGIDCDEAHPKYVEKVVAEAEYTLVFMVKPAGTSIPYEESIWVPLKAFTWRWGGRAKKQPDKTWLPEGSGNSEDPVTSEGFMAEKLSEIVEWETVANENTIKWRLKP